MEQPIAKWVDYGTMGLVILMQILVIVALWKHAQGIQTTYDKYRQEREARDLELMKEQLTTNDKVSTAIDSISTALNASVEKMATELKSLQQLIAVTTRRTRG